MSQAFSRLAALLALVAALIVAAPPAPAAPADPTYTVSGIHVDATAASASAAQTIAIDQGRPRAWDVLFKRIAKQGDWSKQPKLDIDSLRRLSRGFAVTHEKRSTTRYVADVTYIFSPEAVARVMGGISSSYRIVNVRRILLIPMAPNFDRASGWSSAFSSPRFGGSLVPFAVPTGDAPDVKALARLQFDATTWADVEIVAARIHATEAVLALAVPLNGKVQIWLKRIGVAELPTKISIDVPMINKNVTQTYPLAADASVHAIEEMFRQKPPVDFGPRSSLVADVHIDSLQQWSTIQSAFGLVANVVSYQVTAMDIGQIRIVLTYQGPPDALHDALVPVGVALTKGADGNWNMAYAAPPKPTATASP